MVWCAALSIYSPADRTIPEKILMLVKTNLAVDLLVVLIDQLARDNSWDEVCICHLYA